jgi:glycosyltransferase involved in cell wall biosynthesis
MEKNKVSVIIPFFNGVEWLEEAVQSALNQTYKNIEIIVVNDGSSEDVSDFLNKFQDKIIYHYQKNQGSAVARNWGMKNSRGDYLAFLDSDDIWFPEKLEKQIACMETYGFVWCHTGFYNWWPMNGKMKLVNNKYIYGDYSNLSYFSVKIAMPSVVISRRILMEHPEIEFPAAYRKGQDSKFYQQLKKYYKLALLREPLLKVRMTGFNSKGLVLMRFKMKAETYDILNESKIKAPRGAYLVLSIYKLYHKIFGEKRNIVKEFIAKCFWTIPFLLERIFAWYYGYTKIGDKEYCIG